MPGIFMVPKTVNRNKSTIVRNACSFFVMFWTSLLRKGMKMTKAKNESTKRVPIEENGSTIFI